MQSGAEVIPLLPGGVQSLARAGREQLIHAATSYRQARDEWLRREIIFNDRIDLLASVVLGYEVMPFHGMMLRWQFLHPDNQQWMFRGAGKTSLLTVVKAIHILCKCRDIRILISSKTVGNAEGFLKEIKAHLEGTPRLVELFGEFYDPHRVGKWDNREIEVVGRKTKAKEASITCVGVEGTVVSRHYDVLISDDIIDEDNARTKRMRDLVQTWYYKTLLPCLEPFSDRVPHCGEHHRHGTRYHYDDLYGHLQEHELKEHTQVIPALSEDDQSPWPEHYPPDHFKKIRHDSGTIIFNCHSADTEYLTDSGWRLFDEVGSEDRLAVFNSDTAEIDYESPTARHSYDHDGPMVYLKNRGIDALVTPGHRMLARPLYGSDTEVELYRFVEAGELTDVKSSRTGRVQLPSTGVLSGDWRWENFTIPPGRGRGSRAGNIYPEMEVPIRQFAQFLGYFISEGSTSRKVRGPVYFTQNKGKIADEYLAIVRDLGFEPKVHDYEKSVVVRFSHMGLYNWLREHCGTNSGTKRIPRFMFQMVSGLRRAFLVALVNGDGTWNNTGSEASFWYSTTSSGLNDDLHELCLGLGINYTSRVDDQPNPRWATVYAGYGHPGAARGLKVREQSQEVPYKGQVSCFTVPSGTLITKRNGRTLISGNCQYQCETDAMRGEIFQYDHCQRIEDDKIPNGLPVYMGVDLAISKKETSDLTAIVVVSMDKAGNYYVLDYFEGHLRFSEQTIAVKRLYKEHDPVRVAIETNAYQDAQYQHLKDGDRELRLVGIRQDKDKITRAHKLSALFEAKRMFFRTSTFKLIDQLVGFPEHRYDDGFDGLDLAIRASRRRTRKLRRTIAPGLM